MMRKCFIITLISWTCAVSAASDIRDSLSLLRKDLLTRQDKWIPPFQGNHTCINVSVSFSPFTISDLDAASETLTVGAYLRFSWMDNRLTWEPGHYHGSELVEIDESEIWSPRVSLSNGVGKLGPVVTHIPLVVNAYGNINWQTNDIFRTTCKINVTRYPFDTQHCPVLLAPTHGYPVNILLDDFDIISTDGVLDENGEWKFLRVTKHLVQLDGVKFAEFTLSLQRKTIYYIINFIFPMALMSFLNPFVFLIPARSGEKLGFLMAVFVSHAMFLNLIHQTMPPTSDTISRLSLYMALIEIQGFLTILSTIVVLVVHHRNETSENTSLPQTDDTKDKCTCKTTWSTERVLDGVFFVLSLAIAGSSILILFLR